MDTAGKAVLFSGLTVLISLSAVMLVPSPAFRSMALGIMLSVVFVLAATLTLLPAVLAKLGPKVDALPLRWVHSGEHRSARFARWGERLWRHPHIYGPAATLILVLLALPIFGLKTGMPSIKVVPTERRLARRLHAGAAGLRRRRAGRAPDRRARSATPPPSSPPPAATPASPASRPPSRAATASRWSRRSRTPTPRARPSAARSTGSARRCPPSALVGGAAAENHDLEQALAAKTPLVIGVVLALGFLLLLVALQAPLIAALGVLTNLLATGAAFGVARLIFQNGHGAGLLGFESQGFLDAWGPVFFFAMIFAISMDYTVFLLSSAKEHFDRTGDPREAAIGGLAHSGRVIFAAAAVMVAVFFTFALSGPLPPEGDGRHPRHRRPARRDARPARPDPHAAARLRPHRLGAPALARPDPPRRPLRPLLTLDERATLISPTRGQVLGTGCGSVRGNPGQPGNTVNPTRNPADLQRTRRREAGPPRLRSHSVIAPYL